MSSIKLKHASGNSMSIAAPATNPASDLELKLPATIGTAGQVLRNSSTPGTLEFSPALTVVDQWQITADVSTADSLLTSNWARTDSTPTGDYQVFGRIGTGMSQSSGVFTFPTTGIWRIDFTAAAYKADYPRRYISGRIWVTKDDSTYVDTTFSYSSTHADGSSAVYAYSTTSVLLDITSISDCKVKFGVYSDGVMSWMSDSSASLPYTYAIFTRLGDT